MSKSNRQRKEDTRAAAEARKLTAGKVFRLVLKSLAFALVFSLIITLLSLLEIPLLESFWVQLAVMLVVYIAAYPFLMSEFRVRSRKDK